MPLLRKNGRRFRRREGVEEASMDERKRLLPFFFKSLQQELRETNRKQAHRHEK